MRASFTQNGNEWTISTGRAARTLALDAQGRFFCKSWRDLAGGWEAAPSGADEFFVTIDGALLEGRSGGWTAGEARTETLSQGELAVTLPLTRGCLTVERRYVAYPGQPFVGMSTAIVNGGDAAVRVARPSLGVWRQADGADTEFGYMTGGSNFTGSLIYKTLPLTDGYVRTFDSHGKPEMMEVEGVTVDDRHPIPNGTGIWCELYTLRDAGSGRGQVFLFDYQGWWMARTHCADGAAGLRVWCELCEYVLAPGERLETAPMTCALWQGDADDLGNAVADYIYAYKWDYTRERYFLEPTTTIWREAPLTNKVRLMVETAQAIGSRQIHVDDFWFDAKGNWNGIFGDDWTHINAYLKRCGLDFRLWMPPWHADRLSQVWLDHPEWMLNFHGNWYNWTIDLSREEAYQWVLDMLCRKQQAFGTYMLRVDGNPTCMVNDGSFTTSGGNYDASFKQSENFYRLYREFKDRNPEAGLNGCSSGGHTMTIESVRYTDQQQLTDGNCKHYGSYWGTLFNPIDKVACLQGGNMNQNPETQPYTGEQLDAMRRRTVFCNWARQVGVAGRGVHVYRPEVLHGDKTFFLERLSPDGLRGILHIHGGANPGAGKPETVYLKGLRPDALYTVDDDAGRVTPATKTGAEWMRDGVEIARMEPGEVCLNLADRPGRGADTEPPTAPGAPRVTRERWLGHDGNGVEWEASADNGILSHYEVFRDGEPCAKIATGTFFFDADAAPDAKYAVRAVDGDGNMSETVGRRG